MLQRVPAASWFPAYLICSACRCVAAAISSCAVIDCAASSSGGPFICLPTHTQQCDNASVRLELAATKNRASGACCRFL
jgi:hypothetical protein